MPAKPILVQFPAMHAHGRPAPGVLLLDPGLLPRPDPAVHFTPPDLPLDRRAARAWLARSLDFASGFSRPGDLAAVMAAGLPDLYSGTRADIESRLRGMEAAGSGPGPASDAGPAQARILARTRAQMVLLLASGLEEKWLEIRSLEVRVEEAQEGLARAIGPEEEGGDDDEAFWRVQAPDVLLSRPLSLLEEFGLSRAILLESFFCFLPPGALLWADDQALADHGREMGVLLTPLPQGEAVWPGLLQGRAPGHVWCGQGRVPADRPWLAAERVILVPGPDAGGRDGGPP